MSEHAPEPRRSGPSRAWYVAAIVPFLLSLIPAYVLGQAAADEVDVHLNVLTDETVELDGDDQAVYAASEAASERGRCRLHSASGDTVDLNESRSHASTEQDGATWFRVAPVPPNLEDGTYVLRCRAGGEAVESTSLAVSEAPHWGRFVLLLIAAFGVPVAAAVLGTMVFVAVMAMRRRAERGEGPSTSFPIQLDE